MHKKSPLPRPLPPSPTLSHTYLYLRLPPCCPLSLSPFRPIHSHDFVRLVHLAHGEGVPHQSALQAAEAALVALHVPRRAIVSLIRAVAVLIILGTVTSATPNAISVFL